MNDSKTRGSCIWVFHRILVHMDSFQNLIRGNTEILDPWISEEASLYELGAFKSDLKFRILVSTKSLAIPSRNTGSGGLMLWIGI